MTTGLLPLSALALTPSPSPGVSGDAAQTQLRRIAEQIGVAQPPAPLWLVIVTGVMGILVALAFKAFWHLDTVAHEGAHALALVLVGDSVARVDVKRRGHGGATHPVKGPTGLARLFVLFVGYVGSSLFGLLGAVLLGSDRVVAALAFGLVLLAMLLVVLRTLFGIVVVLLTGIALVGAIAGEGLALQWVVAYSTVWFLLTVGMPSLLALRTTRRAMTKEKRRKSGSDVDQLRNLTWIPGAVWLWLQFAVCAVVLVTGGRLMLT